MSPPVNRCQLGAVQAMRREAASLDPRVRILPPPVRSLCRTGVKFGRKPKLTKHQIREIMGRLETGETCRSIAKSYNVIHMTISRLQPTWSMQRLAITHKKQQPSQGNEAAQDAPS